MAIILPPPILEGKLPAQILDDDTRKWRIKIPYTLSRATNFSLIKSVWLRYAPIGTGQPVYKGGYRALMENGHIQANGCSIAMLNSDQYDKGERVETLLPVGFYKVQLAFSPTNARADIGPWSNVGVFKSTRSPIALTQYMTETTNKNNPTFFPPVLNVEYTLPEEDLTELPYKYRFDIMDLKENIIETSGDIFENSYIVKTIPQANKKYKIVITITTINKLVSTLTYYAQALYHTREDVQALAVIPNEEKGYNEINWNFPMIVPLESTFRVRRRNEDTGEDLIIALYNYPNGATALSNSVKDFFIEQGSSYSYYLERWGSEGNVECYAYSQPVRNFFEDIFLLDGKDNMSLSIKFNPKVSSFKTVLQEQKIDTIGSKYPLFVRNANLAYKEFPINGLLSCLTQDDFIEHNQRMSTASQSIVINSPANLTGENFYQERLFKLSVLDWLNNGNVKLIRSPAEGNYLVRLMNTSLNPMDQLGRMLHSFSSTAYEVAPINRASLEEYGFIRQKDLLYEGASYSPASATSVDFIDSSVRRRRCFWMRLSAPAESDVLFTVYTDPTTEITGDNLANFTKQEINILAGQSIEFSFPSKVYTYIQSSQPNATMLYLTTMAGASDTSTAIYEITNNTEDEKTFNLTNWSNMHYIRLEIDADYLLENSTDAYEECYYKLGNSDVYRLSSGSIELSQLNTTYDSITISPHVIGYIYGIEVQENE